jgi:mono/diheme cytochrome c family protein
MNNSFGVKFFGLFFLFSVFGLLSMKSGISNIYSNHRDKVGSLTVEEARIALGGEPLKHTIEEADPKKALIGKNLIEKGQTKRGLFKSKIISPYFVCTDCHNVGREFEVASDQSPNKRLDYAKQKNLPFLPGSTFWGIYNRTNFYNDDYIKKYGDKISVAKTSLTESIQVCAKYCSAGRNLKDWEVEAIMHYFKQNELKLTDLNLTLEQLTDLMQINQLSQDKKVDLLNVLDASYVKGYAAHFSETMPKDERKYGEGGNVADGKFIYENACLYCHKDGRVSNLKLDNDLLSGRMFVNHMEDYTDHSPYQIIRWGTYTMAGRNQYMPRYTKDKMSDQQLEDLMAYIRQIAQK